MCIYYQCYFNYVVYDGPVESIRVGHYEFANADNVMRNWSFLHICIYVHGLDPEVPTLLLGTISSNYVLDIE